MAYERPAGSDPLDVRDVFDWLEPLVELDEASLKTAVVKHAASSFVREHGWVIAAPYGEGWRLVNHGYGNQWRTVVEVMKRPISVTRTLRIPADAEALIVRGGGAGDRAPVTTFELLVGGQSVSKLGVPPLSDTKNPPSTRFPLPPGVRGRELRCELIIASTQETPQIDIRGISFALLPK